MHTLKCGDTEVKAGVGFVVGQPAFGRFNIIAVLNSIMFHLLFCNSNKASLALLIACCLNCLSE